MNQGYLDHAVRSSFVDMLDKSLLISLRDGRNFVGVLRTFDQYSNIVLEDASERVVFNGMCADKFVGVQVIRGDTIVLMGDMNERKPEVAMYLKRVTMEELDKAKAAAAETATLAKPVGFENE